MTHTPVTRGKAASTFSDPIRCLDAVAMHWHSVELISDLHLQASQPKTFAAFQAYLSQCNADALCILGDLFEAWIGDDVLDADAFAQACVQSLAACAAQRPVYILYGNRDFLIGERFLEESQCQLLADPCVLQFAQHRYLLSHGDAYCYADEAYMRSRAVLQSPAWREATLAKSLAERQQMVAQVRNESRLHQSGLAVYADLDPDAMRTLLEEHRATTLVHGHTHRPADQTLSDTLRRIVLSDWDGDAVPARAEVLRITEYGAERRKR